MLSRVAVGGGAAAASAATAMVAFPDAAAANSYALLGSDGTVGGPGGSPLTSSVAIVSSPNSFSVQQTFTAPNATTAALKIVAAAGQTANPFYIYDTDNSVEMFQFLPTSASLVLQKAADTTHVPTVRLNAKNTALFFGVDNADPTLPARDWFLGWWNAAGTSYLGDEFYGNKPSDTELALWNFGAGGDFKRATANLPAVLNATTSETGTAALVARGRSGLTVPVFAVTNGNSANQAFQVMLDGEVDGFDTNGQQIYSLIPNVSSGGLKIIANKSINAVALFGQWSDANPKVAFSYKSGGAGQVGFGIGGSSALDQFLYHISNGLECSGGFSVGGSLAITGNLTQKGSDVGFFNTSPAAQQGTTGSAIGYTTGSTTATFHSDDTYTGNTGTTAYTINGIVAALKTYGLLRA
jgi:hypothetical protein